MKEPKGLLEMRVLGLDPSLKSTGWGVLDYNQNDYTVVGYGTIKPPHKLPIQHKVNRIRMEVETLIKTYDPEEVSLENPFFAHNVKTALILGQVRGAVLVAVASQERNLSEYSALEIKKAVTGYGQADKHQVNDMVKTLLHIHDDKMSLDASDALAAAVCHSHSRIFQQKLES